MTTPRLHTVERPGPGRLSIVARPRGGEWLEDELLGLRSLGVDVLVSMLTQAEEAELGLTGEPTAAKAAGLRFLALPTVDRGVPAEAPFRALLAGLALEMQAGRHVAVHCRLSVGRSSLVAAGLLMLAGSSPDEAWSAICAARGRECPDTPEQRLWLDGLAIGGKPAPPW